MSTLATQAPPKRGRPPKAAAPMQTTSVFSPNVAVRLGALLSEYDKQVVQDATQLRTYITNKLLEISSCGITKDELKALELLGKISDIGLFVEKSEVQITHTASADLEDLIREKLDRMMQTLPAVVVEDEEEAEFEEEESEEPEEVPDDEEETP